MIRRFVRSVIRNATVTATRGAMAPELNLDPRLMNGAGILAFEQVEIINASTGDRFETWVIPGNVGEVAVGAGERHPVRRGDVIIIVSHGLLHDGQTLEHRPRMLELDAANGVVNLLERRTAVE